MTDSQLDRLIGAAFIIAATFHANHLPFLLSLSIVGGVLYGNGWFSRCDK